MRTVLIADSRDEAIASLRSLSEVDILRTDRDGRVVSGTGLPQQSIGGEKSALEQAYAFSRAWLAGKPDEASTLLPGGPFIASLFRHTFLTTSSTGLKRSLRKPGMCQASTIRL